MKNTFTCPLTLSAGVYCIRRFLKLSMALLMWKTKLSLIAVVAAVSQQKSINSQKSDLKERLGKYILNPVT